MVDVLTSFFQKGEGTLRRRDRMMQREKRGRKKKMPSNDFIGFSKIFKKDNKM